LNSIINFFDKIVNIFDNYDRKNIPLGDQSIINMFKHEINYDFIPNEFVVFGKDIYNKNKSLIHHATYCTYNYQKIDQINIIKLMMKNKNGCCDVMNKKYSWNDERIEFLENGEMDAFGKGYYAECGKNTFKVIFGGRIHTIIFNEKYTEFVSTRDDDGDEIKGKIISE